MKKPADSGPVCPGCGYAIFGLRDMKCPECGRLLDVRDFKPENAAHRGESARYERTAAVGGVIAIVLILGLLAGLIAVVRYFMRFHVVPGVFLLAIGLLAVILVGVVAQTGQSIGFLFKGRRK